MSKLSCTIAGAFHIELDENHPEQFEAAVQLHKESLLANRQPLFVMCRRGNNSQRAVSLLKQKFGARAVDLEGGAQNYAAFDHKFPML